MRTNLRRGAHALTMVVLTAAVGLSGRVEAQQTGLFPLAPIRRQRVPCDQEDPTYKIYKQQYFGYHPTCWRTFPPGWGCPSAEAPNKERSFREVPPGNAPEELGPEMPPEEERGAQPPRRRPGIPELPPERSPFEMPGEVPGATPLPPDGTTPPRTTPPARDPFRDLNSPGASNSPSRNRSQRRNASTMPDDGTPELAAPGGQPAQGSASRSGRRDSDGEDLPADDQGPLLGLSDSDIVRSDAGSADDSQSAAPAASTESIAAASAPAPAAQPRRRLFGNLFSSLGSNWIRR